MTNTFDPATHRFGDAYTFKDGGVFYPFVQQSPRRWQCISNDKELGYYIFNADTAYITHIHEHDLIPRANVEQLRQSHADLLEHAKDMLDYCKSQVAWRDFKEAEQAIANAEKV